MGARTKRWTGRITQAAGTLTGNRKLEREGRADRRTADAQERFSRAKGKVDKVIDHAAKAVKGTIGTGKGRSRRT
jgi:uncharacterized protein YjbJ (UPF0337 family)